jgi:glycopeptide antibiotics resistance protein
VALPPKLAAHKPLTDNRWFVLATLFFVMAILGLPLLWRSRAFSTAGKILVSFLVTVYTIALIWAVWLVLVWFWSPIIPALRSSG